MTKTTILAFTVEDIRRILAKKYNVSYYEVDSSKQESDSEVVFKIVKEDPKPEEEY